VVQPNVIFGMDDSGSMDFEVLLNTSDGAFWWNNSTGTGWDARGAPLFNLAGDASSTWWKLTYLFPNGCDPATRRLCDNPDPRQAHYAIPPTAQFASLRSSAYNPAYYNPNTTYAPWPDATLGTTPRSFGNASPTAALSHPLFATTHNLTAVVDSVASDWVFRGLRGMTIPSGSRIFTNRWVTLSSPVVIGQGSYPNASYNVAVPYFPASYWTRETCTTNGTTCVLAPDGNTLRLCQPPIP